MDFEREPMNIVIVGHVDHGKSTVIGRLLADTGSLPEGKLEQVQRNCERNAKPFEYAFLLDALKDEQAQGITIDTARCFFQSAQRRYIIIDAPGHSEFLKNMITGAARAEAALLVIDAKEGVRENSRRHGFILAMLGVRQIVVLVNKMDLIDFDQRVYDQVVAEFGDFLAQINVKPRAFIPVSARNGDNLAFRSDLISWYKGLSVLELMDGLPKAKGKGEQPLRLPVQDIYKFTEDGDDRRIFAGTVESGRIKVGDSVIFLPSGKTSTVASIEGFQQSLQTSVAAGSATGLTLTTQVYVKPGEIICRTDEPLPHCGRCFKANLFWMGKRPCIKGKTYKLKLVTNRATVVIEQINQVLNSADLTTTGDCDRVERHEVGECVLKTLKPIAFDRSEDIEATGRFVIVDNYEIVGGGIITEALTAEEYNPAGRWLEPQFSWERTGIFPREREQHFEHKPRFIVLTGTELQLQQEVARALERLLFESGYSAYYLGMGGNPESAKDNDGADEAVRFEQIRRLSEFGKLLCEAGQILITSIPVLELDEIQRLQQTNQAGETIVMWLNPDCPAAGPVIPIHGATISEILAKVMTILDYHENIRNTILPRIG